MPTNLRLRPDVANAVKAEATRTGRSQQDIMRDAIESYLGRDRPPRSVSPVISDILPPRTPWRRPASRIRLPKGSSSMELLDREDRL